MTAGRRRSNLPSPRRSQRIRSAYPRRSPRLNPSLMTTSPYQSRNYSYRYLNRRARTRFTTSSPSMRYSFNNNQASGQGTVSRLSSLNSSQQVFRSNNIVHNESIRTPSQSSSHQNSSQSSLSRISPILNQQQQSPNHSTTNSSFAFNTSNSRSASRPLFSSNYNGRSYNIHYSSNSNNNNNPESNNLSPNITTNQDNNSNPRICYCDQPIRPPQCNQCTEYSPHPCSFHQPVNCTNEACSRRYHLGCLSMSLGKSLSEVDTNEFHCINCVFNSTSPSISWDNLTSEISKKHRFGFLPTSNIRNVRKSIDILETQCSIPNYVTSSFKNQDPNPYPSFCPITDESMTNHLINGRRFEISQLMYSINTCDCCGRTQPFHEDPFFPSNAPFKRRHFCRKYFPAWHCQCDNFCKGSQFYPSKKSSLLKYYKEKHNNKFPWEILNCPRNSPNAILCNHCTNEISSKNVKDLQFGRMFSTRNGFGKTIIYNNLSSNEDINIYRAIEIQKLFPTLTAAEESAIRQITPLLSIVRLNTGSIGMKGNTSCVWQKSRLNIILPNLPSECSYIIIKRKVSNNNSNFHTNTTKSTKFKRSRIQKALELLSHTVPDVWKSTSTFPIQIDVTRLNEWPLEGDLVDLLESSTIEPTSDETDLNTSLHINSDNGDEGPAPLQNNVQINEEYDGIINFHHNAQNSSSLVANQILNDAISRLRSRSNDLDPQNNSHTRDTVTFNQPDVINVTNNFVNMYSTPFSWSRAFPSIFYPVYIKINNQFQWTILGDITGSTFTRDVKVNMLSWEDYLFWRSDGLPSAHPTFSLVLYNHKLRNSLQKQGFFVLNSSDVDTNIKLDEIKNAPPHSNISNLVTSLLSKLTVHSSNIPCTRKYWQNTRFEYKALTFYNSYINKNEVSMFHTGSLAEFHEYPLRVLLANYVSKLSFHDNDEFSEILHNDQAFSKAVQKYKHIVTHYLASKFELWNAFMLLPIYGIDLCLSTFEFAKSRGAIHFHSLIASKSATTKNISNSLHQYSISVSESMDKLNTFIKDHYSFSLHGREYPSCPSLETGNDSMELRKKFCYSLQDGKQIFDTCIEEFSLSKNIAQKEIGYIMESQYGFNALHEGNSPEHWVKPGGLSIDHYRSTSSNMLSSNDVIERNELMSRKSVRENNLFNRSINITNQCRTHKCSNYCLKDIIYCRKFNPNNDSNIPEEDIFTNQSGDIQVKVKCKECRMHFGRALKFDSSGENNITRGIKFNQSPTIEFDKNYQPRFYARRNHPRIVQSPYLFHFYGANCDSQPLLVNQNGDSYLQEIGSENYKNYYFNLLCSGHAGLEQHNAGYVVEEYISSYSCKGGENSRLWKQTSESVIKEYCSRPQNSNKTIRSLVAKHMNEIASGCSIS